MQGHIYHAFADGQEIRIYIRKLTDSIMVRLRQQKTHGSLQDNNANRVWVQVLYQVRRAEDAGDSPTGRHIVLGNAAFEFGEDGVRLVHSEKRSVGVTQMAQLAYDHLRHNLANNLLRLPGKTVGFSIRAQLRGYGSTIKKLGAAMQYSAELGIAPYLRPGLSDAHIEVAISDTGRKAAGYTRDNTFCRLINIKPSDVLSRRSSTLAHEYAHVMQYETSRELMAGYAGDLVIRAYIEAAARLFEYALASRDGDKSRHLQRFWNTDAYSALAEYEHVVGLHLRYCLENGIPYGDLPIHTFVMSGQDKGAAGRIKTTVRSMKQAIRQPKGHPEAKTPSPVKEDQVMDKLIALHMMEILRDSDFDVGDAASRFYIRHGQ